MSINRKTGKFKLVENGKKAVDKYNKEVVDWMSQMTNKVRS